MRVVDYGKSKVRIAGAWLVVALLVSGVGVASSSPASADVTGTVTFSRSTLVAMQLFAVDVDVTGCPAGATGTVEVISTYTFIPGMSESEDTRVIASESFVADGSGAASVSTDELEARAGSVSVTVACLEGVSATTVANEVVALPDGFVLSVDDATIPVGTRVERTLRGGGCAGGQVRWNFGEMVATPSSDVGASHDVAQESTFPVSGTADPDESGAWQVTFSVEVDPSHPLLHEQHAFATCRYNLASLGQFYEAVPLTLAGNQPGLPDDGPDEGDVVGVIDAAPHYAG